MSAKHATASKTDTSKTSASGTTPDATPSNLPQTAAAHDLAVKNAQKRVLKAATDGVGMAEAQTELQAAVTARKEFATKRLPLACKHFLDLPADAADAAKSEAMKELRSALSALASIATPAGSAPAA